MCAASEPFLRQDSTCVLFVCCNCNQGLLIHIVCHVKKGHCSPSHDRAGAIVTCERPSICIESERAIAAAANRTKHTVTPMLNAGEGVLSSFSANSETCGVFKKLTRLACSIFVGVGFLGLAKARKNSVALSCALDVDWSVLV